MYKRHPHGHGGDKEHYKQAGDGKVEGQHLEGRSHQILPSVMPKWISPCSIWLGTPHSPCKVSQEVEAQVAAGGSGMCSTLFPFRGGLGRFSRDLLQDAEPASATPSPITSPHTWFSALWLQLSQGILVGQPPEGCLCVPGAVPAARAEIPRIFCGSDAVASGLSAPPQLRVKQAGKGPRKGKLGVCLSKSHGSELVAIIP